MDWNRELILKTLVKAADTFVQHVDGTVEIWAASKDWFLEEWGRDTFIALPGILLVTNRYDEAREVFRHFAKFEVGGLIPNRIKSGEILYNTVDGSLWYINALKAYFEKTADKDFIIELLPTLRAIINGYQNGTTFWRFGKMQQIKMDDVDNLIVSPAQSTWMDADPKGDGSTIVTPRNGKAVEINALWYKSLKFVADCEDQAGEVERANELRLLAYGVKSNFGVKFWNEAEDCLLDVIDGDPHSGAIRCNQIFAVSHGEDLLSKEQQELVLDSVTKDLLTPYGLRTLSSRDSNYRGNYNTEDPIVIKDWAYHQGTVWPWLIGAYCDAIIITELANGVSEIVIKEKLKTILKPLILYCLQSETKSLPEVFSGDFPYQAGGTRSQAWSVGEVLRILVENELV